jgi:hypothetical protein
MGLAIAAIADRRAEFGRKRHAFETRTVGAGGDAFDALQEAARQGFD